MIASKAKKNHTVNQQKNRTTLVTKNAVTRVVITFSLLGRLPQPLFFYAIPQLLIAQKQQDHTLD